MSAATVIRLPHPVKIPTDLHESKSLLVYQLMTQIFRQITNAPGDKVFDEWMAFNNTHKGDVNLREFIHHLFEAMLCRSLDLHISTDTGVMLFGHNCIYNIQCQYLTTTVVQTIESLISLHLNDPLFRSIKKTPRGVIYCNFQYNAAVNAAFQSNLFDIMRTIIGYILVHAHKYKNHEYTFLIIQGALRDCLRQLAPCAMTASSSSSAHDDTRISVINNILIELGNTDVIEFIDTFSGERAHAYETLRQQNNEIQ